jgi:hypothetical protein
VKKGEAVRVGQFLDFGIQLNARAIDELEKVLAGIRGGSGEQRETKGGQDGEASKGLHAFYVSHRGEKDKRGFWRGNKPDASQFRATAERSAVPNPFAGGLA